MAAMRAVMLYGVSKGYGSYARVTAGWLKALEELNLIAGFHAVDEPHGDGMASDGYDAPVAVYVGPSGGWPLMTQYGEHVERCAVLAPNSTWLPEQLVDNAEKYLTRVLATSWWARDIIHRHLREREGVGLSVVNHGSCANHQDLSPTGFALYISRLRQARGRAQLS